jgi:meso-butanediol dehydrogenase/(S,S)-butanediol dehydrogenase/diacetyl reductase
VPAYGDTMTRERDGRPGRLAGKVAAITGTAGGQGRAAAIRFAAEGAVVAGCDRSAEGAAETVRLVEAAGGRMTSAHPVDLTHEAATKAWIAEVVATHGRIDVLYANAGATRFSPIADTTFEEWSWVLRHELDIVFLPVRHAWPHLVASRGSIVLVGSTAGIRGSMTNTRIAHTATKGGVVAMTKQLAAEGASHGIRVNCVSPGMVRTPATEGDLLADDSPMREIASHIPLGRIGDPDEVVSCALFLASDEASYVTGANLVVDGGWSAVLPGA